MWPDADRSWKKRAMEVACGVELQELGNTVTAVCPFWIKDTEFVTRTRETRETITDANSQK